MDFCLDDFHFCLSPFSLQNLDFLKIIWKMELKINRMKFPLRYFHFYLHFWLNLIEKGEMLKQKDMWWLFIWLSSLPQEKRPTQYTNQNLENAKNEKYSIIVYLTFTPHQISWNGLSWSKGASLCFLTLMPLDLGIQVPLISFM